MFKFNQKIVLGFRFLATNLWSLVFGVPSSVFRLRSFFFMLFSVFFFFETNAQCAMCRAVLESEEGQATAEGINDGIVYLMAIPYLLVGAAIFFVYRKYNSSKTK